MALDCVGLPVALDCVGLPVALDCIGRPVPAASATLAKPAASDVDNTSILPQVHMDAQVDGVCACAHEYMLESMYTTPTKWQKNQAWSKP